MARSWFGVSSQVSSKCRRVAPGVLSLFCRALALRSAWRAPSWGAQSVSHISRASRGSHGPHSPMRRAKGGRVRPVTPRPRQSPPARRIASPISAVLHVRFTFVGGSCDKVRPPTRVSRRLEWRAALARGLFRRPAALFNSHSPFTLEDSMAHDAGRRPASALNRLPHGAGVRTQASRPQR